MKNMFRAILDSFYTVKSGSPYFFDYVGSKIQSSLLKVVHPDDVQTFANAIKRIENGEVCEEPIRIKNTEGNYTLFYLRFEKAEPVKGSNDFLISISGVDMSDAFDRIRNMTNTISELRAMQSFCENLCFEYTPDDEIISVYWINRNQTIILDKLPFNQWKEKTLSLNYIDEEYLPIFEELCSDIINMKPTFSYEFISSIFSKGERMECTTIRGGYVCDDLKPYKIVGTIIATENEKAKAIPNLTIKATKDPMTGVLNKNTIIKYTRDLIATSNNPVVMAIIDLDNFKLVNDTFGHLYGDKVIIKFAEILSTVVGNKGVIGRFGGDEFLVVLEDIKNELELRSYLRAIRTTIEYSFANLAEDISLSCSIGAATFPKDANDYDELFNKADYCLYIAKQRGKNRYVMFDYMVKEHNYIDDKLMLNSDEKKNNQITFICNITDILLTADLEKINEVLAEVGNRYNLDKISVYLGDDLAVHYKWGAEFADDNASYLKADSYESNFDENSSFVINHMPNIELKNPTAFEYLSRNNVLSAVQHILGSKDNIVGLISFETLQTYRHWQDDEIYIFSFISYLINKTFFEHSN